MSDEPKTVTTCRISKEVLHKVKQAASFTRKTPLEYVDAILLEQADRDIKAWAKSLTGDES